MQNISSQLNAARKAKGYTQEQLAAMINVSRQTISHWERGRAMPDIDMLKELSRILGCNFLEADVPPAVESKAAAAADEIEYVYHEPLRIYQEPAPRRRSWPIILLIIAAAAIITAVAGVFLWRMLPAADTAGRGPIVISAKENPCPPVFRGAFPDGIGWFYEFTIENTSSGPLKIVSGTLCDIAADGTEYCMELNEALIDAISESGVIPARHRTSFTGGMPLQELSAVRLSLKYTDENGINYTCEYTITLSHETDGALTVPDEPSSGIVSIGDIPAASEYREGAAYIDISPSNNPVKALYDDNYSGGIGWRYTLNIENTGDTVFNVTSAAEYHIISDSDEASVIRYDDDILKSLFGDMALEPGYTTSWNGGMPLQAISAVKLVISGTDANGNELVFVGTVELSQEIED